MIHQVTPCDKCKIQDICLAYEWLKGQYEPHKTINLRMHYPFAEVIQATIIEESTKIQMKLECHQFSDKNE